MEAQLRVTTTQEEVIRYRIEKRMAGLRDVFLHIVVYVLVLGGVWIYTPWWDTSARILFAILWAIPLVLQFLRYYHQNGAGARRRVAEIERAINQQLELSALNEEEELLIEERITRKISARRWIVAHFLVMAPLLAVIWAGSLIDDPWRFDADSLIDQTAAWMGVFFLHWLRFYFVHGKTADGRASKIEREIERQWHHARGRARERRNILENGAEEASADDRGSLSLGRLRLTDEGELLDDTTLEHSQSLRGRAGHQAQS